LIANSIGLGFDER